MASFGSGRMGVQSPVTLKGPADVNFIKELIKGQANHGGVSYRIGSEKHHIFDEGDPIFSVRGSGTLSGVRKLFASLNGMRLKNGSVEETEDTMDFLGINLNNWSPTKESYKDTNQLGWNVSGGEELMLPLTGPVSAGDSIAWSLPDPRDPNFKQQIKPGFPIERLTPQFGPLDWRESAYIVEGMVMDMLSPEGRVKGKSIPDHVSEDTLTGLSKREVAAFHSRVRTLMTVMRGVEVLLQRRVIDILSVEQEELRRIEARIMEMIERMFDSNITKAEQQKIQDLMIRRKEFKNRLSSLSAGNVFQRTSFGGTNTHSNDDRLNSKYTLNQWKYKDPRNMAATKEEVNNELNTNKNKIFWLANACGVMGVSERTLPSQTLIDDIIKTVNVGCLDPNVSDPYLSLFPDSESSLDPITRIYVGQYLANAVNHVKDDGIAFAGALDHIKRKVIGVATSHNNNNSELMTKTGVIYTP